MTDKKAVKWLLQTVGKSKGNMVLRQLEEATRSSMENRLKESLFKKLLRKDYGQVSAVHSEEWMNRMTSDTERGGKLRNPDCHAAVNRAITGSVIRYQRGCAKVLCHACQCRASDGD